MILNEVPWYPVLVKIPNTEILLRQKEEGHGPPGPSPPSPRALLKIIHNILYTIKFICIGKLYHVIIRLVKLN